ncbi:MAG: hypothetical protein RQ733_04420 [Methyloprofundus sp.]|nr:hypothetical protein [Methyloprofundus sp.]MDT8425198.1 hypothetical protein [Methyloprofundus sp.]
MINFVGGANAPGLATALMNKKTAEEELAVTVIKKGQDIEKAQGEAAVKMIESAAPGRIDTYA